MVTCNFEHVLKSVDCAVVGALCLYTACHGECHVGDVVLIAVRLKHGLRHGSLQNLHSGPGV